MLNIYSSLRFLSQSNNTTKKSRYVVLALLALSNTAILSSANAMDEDALEAVSKMAIKPQKPLAPIGLANIVETPTALVPMNFTRNFEVDTTEGINPTIAALEERSILDDVRDLGPIELLSRGYHRDAILSANYPSDELFAAGFTLHELGNAGYSNEELLTAGDESGLFISLEDIDNDSITVPTTEVGSIRENEYNQGGEFPETLPYSITITTPEDNNINNHVIEDRPLYDYHSDVSPELRGLLTQAKILGLMTHQEYREILHLFQSLAIQERSGFSIFCVNLQQNLQAQIRAHLQFQAYFDAQRNEQLQTQRSAYLQDRIRAHILQEVDQLILKEINGPAPAA